MEESANHVQSQKQSEDTEKTALLESQLNETAAALGVLNSDGCLSVSHSIELEKKKFSDCEAEHKSQMHYLIKQHEDAKAQMKAAFEATLEDTIKNNELKLETLKSGFDQSNLDSQDKMQLIEGSLSFLFDRLISRENVVIDRSW